MEMHNGKKLLLTAIALIGVGVVVPAAKADQKTGKSGNVTDQEEPRGRLGEMQVSSDVKSGIQSSLGSIVKSALNKDLDDVVDNFAKADRDRIDRASEKIDTETAFDQLRDKIRAKYSRDIDFTSSSMKPTVFNYNVTSGGSNKQANVVIPASHGLQQLTLKFVDEGMLTSSWRLDVPDTVTAAQLKNSLIQHVQQLNSSDQLPTDQQEGAKLIAHHILAAVSGEQMALNTGGDQFGSSSSSGSMGTSDQMGGRGSSGLGSGSNKSSGSQSSSSGMGGNSTGSSNGSGSR